MFLFIPADVFDLRVSKNVQLFTKLSVRWQRQYGVAFECACALLKYVAARFTKQIIAMLGGEQKRLQEEERNKIIIRILKGKIRSNFGKTVMIMFKKSYTSKLDGS